MNRRRWLLPVTIGALLCVLGSVFITHQEPLSGLSITPISSTPIVQTTPNGSKHTKNAPPLQVVAHSVRTPTPVPSHLATPTPLLSPTPTAPSSDNSANWTLIYNDDFNGTQLSSTWGKYGGPHGGGQSYYDPSEVTVSNGLLHIAMERKTTGGLLYTTGGLAAFNLAQVYGKYEMSVRLPRGKGVGPYAILWPQTTAPNTAQVDIFESPPVNKTTLYFTNHGVDGSSTVRTANGNFADGFHTIGCEWMPGELRFLVDGVVQGTITTSVFTQPMWFGMAVASGDAFTGLPDATTALPVSMDVDWVHIYKYNG